MKKIVERYRALLIGITAILIFLSVRGCVNKQSEMLAGMNNVWKQQVYKLKDSVAITEKNRLKQKDSIKKETAKKELYIKSLQEKSLASENRVNALEKEAVKSKEKIKNLSYEESAREYNKIYNTNNAEALNTGVILKNTLPNLVLETVADANYCQDIVKEKDVQLQAKDSIIVIKDGQIKDSSVLLFSAEKQIQAEKDLNQTQETLNLGLKKENNKLKQKSFIDNWVIKPLVFVAGVLIGTQASK